MDTEYVRKIADGHNACVRMDADSVHKLVDIVNARVWTDIINAYVGWALPM